MKIEMKTEMETEMETEMPGMEMKVHCKKLLFHCFKWNTLGCCSAFHGNISVKAEITWKRFDLCTEILVATMAIYAYTIVGWHFLLYPLFPIQGNHCNNPGCYI